MLLAICVISCSTDKANKKETITTGSKEFYFEQGLKVKDPSEMVKLFEKGLSQSSANNDSIDLYLMDGLIYSYNRLKEYDSSLVYIDSLINTATKNADSSFIALGYYRKATLNRYLNHSEEVYRNAYRSRNIYLALGDSSKAGRRTLEMANAQSRMSDYTGSQQTATRALSLLSEEHDSIYISSAFNVIAMSYRDRGFYHDALKEYQHALEYSTTTEDSLSFLNNIALVNRDLDDHEKALSSFRSILKKADDADEESRARFIDNYAYTQWLQDHSAPVIDDLQQALRIRQDHNDLDGLSSSYDHLSKYYESSDPQLALDYATRFLETARKNSGKIAQLNALKRLINLSPAGRSKEYSEKFIALNDSIQKENLQAANLFAKIKFDEEQKQKQIKDLEITTRRQQLETERLNNQILVLSLGSLLLLTTGGFIFYYFKQKHKREKIEEIHRTEFRISKRIHDELANDIYNIMSSLESSAPDHTLDKLESVYSRTRDISRENRQIDTGNGYLRDLTSLLTSNTSSSIRLILRGQEGINWNTISSEKKIVIYRVLQEIMVNMKKHSEAKLVAIIFSKDRNFLTINYSDNGKGCTPGELRKGNGYQNAENRIFSSKGYITFEAEKGKGLKIFIKIPV